MSFPSDPGTVSGSVESDEWYWGSSHPGLQQNKLPEHVELSAGPECSVGLLHDRVVKSIIPLRGFI